MNPAPLDAQPVPAVPAFGRELEVAVRAVRAAARIQLDRLGRLERIVHKSAKDVVTEVDHLCEEAIIATIRDGFEEDPFLAEESGHSGARRGSAPVDGSASAGPVTAEHRIWIVDPLDGTVNYANAIPIFCTSVALAVGGRPAVGVVLDPVRDDLYCAVAGSGAWLNGRPVRHPGKEKLSDTICHVAFPATRYARREARLRRAIRVTRVFGSAALALAYLADGRFDSFLQVRGLSLWDIAAAGLIAEESGATVTDTAGGPWFDLQRATRASGIVAATPAHHGALLDLLR